ncbi:DUF305 domain-containing protein [Marisediminicola antarctica]|uniref:DUF305 domain-containing protein n=1 Tax=Marisediminicola antarctica TaxID=674079 RepID=A0A7L5AMF7_9MICO|nr:DUF305 domain-containing protein [Marisediminicola antarctica]QHO70301.1 DUF305 domain-containing protein [Marisediminicola antarctica]
MFNKRILLAVVGVLAASLTLSACSTGTSDTGSDSPGSSSDAAATFNDQDVSFAQSMVVHHSQAIDMAQVILDKDGIEPRVTELAQDIKDAQGPEIEQLNGFLEQWEAPSEMEGMDGMDGMDGMAGTMSEQDMADLETATGIEASRLFLEQMTVHHEGAVEMAQVQVDEGEDPDATALAQKIIDDQNAELELMDEILATL